MTTDRYILDSSNPVPEPDLLKWASWFEGFGNRILSKTEIFGTQVSTIFLGLDHSFGDGPPLLFETMIFSPDSKELDCIRYSTWDEAVAGHLLSCSKCMKGDYA